MRILYVTTSFPVFSETFLQREARALLKMGVELKIISLHKGEALFDGHAVDRFSKWRLLTLFYKLPMVVFRHSSEMREGFGLLGKRWPTYSLNFFENLLGFGAAIALDEEIRAFKPDLVHCVWSSAPGAFGRLANLLTGIPYSLGAHAYDIFEYGGDWLLKEKVESACLVHVSTAVAEEQILKYADFNKVFLIRRGLNELPSFKAMRESRRRLRIACVARLVEKKGFPYQLEIYATLKREGVLFETVIIGDGPMSEEIQQGINRLGLSENVILMGRLSEGEVMAQLQWADVLFHTGIVAASGDRDGLPNVVPEAMASGVIVIGSPVSGVVEAIQDEVTGFLCASENPEHWIRTCRRIQCEDTLCENIARNARDWVEREFVADVNTGQLVERMKAAVGKK